MQRTEMNKGVQILLERMQSNPEEFIPDWRGDYPPKWKRKLDAVARRVIHIHSSLKNKDDYYPELPFLSDNEILELWNAMQNILASRFTEEVMATLLEDADDNVSSYTELSSLSSQVLSGSSKPTGNITLSSSQIKSMEHLDVYERKHLMDLMAEYEKLQNGGTITFNTKSRTTFKGKK